MTVRFTVEPSGRVGSSSIAGSTLGDAATDACIVAAVERLVFPPPDGGGPVTDHLPPPVPPVTCGRTASQATTCIWLTTPWRRLIISM